MAQSGPVHCIARDNALCRHGIHQGDMLTFEEKADMIKGKVYVFQVGDMVDVGRLYATADGQWYGELPHFNKLVPVSQSNVRGKLTRVTHKVCEF